MSVGVARRERMALLAEGRRGAIRSVGRLPLFLSVVFLNIAEPSDRVVVIFPVVVGLGARWLSSLEEGGDVGAEGGGVVCVCGG